MLLASCAWLRTGVTAQVDLLDVHNERLATATDSLTIARILRWTENALAHRPENNDFGAVAPFCTLMFRGENPRTVPIFTNINGQDDIWVELHDIIQLYSLFGITLGEDRAESGSGTKNKD
jgi:hypothetical protein